MRNIKINDITFDKIEKGEINYIIHGYSMNKKYISLQFCKELLFVNVSKTKSIIKNLKILSIFEMNNKKYFKLEFE